MKTVRKALLLVLCAALLVGATAMGTYAYFTSTDSATNTFTVGKVAITLDETKVTEDGKPVVGANRVKGNEYHLLPGQSYTKDPVVHIQPDSEESYIRLLVTMTKYDEAKTVLECDSTTGIVLLQNYVDWQSENWDYVDCKVAADSKSATYEFRYKTTVSNSSETAVVHLEPLFTTITMPGELTNTQIAKLEGLNINVVAQAIQAAGFDDADDAWSHWTN